VKSPRCLTNGVHTPGSQWEAECPVLRREAALNLENAVPGRVVAESLRPPGTAPKIPITSNTVVRNGRAFKPGRPTAAAPGRSNADRQRAYRARQLAAQRSANDALLTGGAA
jgi:hypothetical protein